MLHARLIRCVIVLAGLLVLGASSSASAAAAAFTRWLEGIWPEAQKIGVTRKTFEAKPTVSK